MREGQDDIIVALKHHDRVIQIDIRGQNRFTLEKSSAMAQKPFTHLTDLHLASTDDMPPVLHEKFLGGSAPCLRYFSLWNIAFPTFPKLAVSATHLSYLLLWNIPITGYISPKAQVGALPSLKFLFTGFRSPLLSHVEQLEIHEHTPGDTRRGNGIDPTQWLELFGPFLAVKNLHVYGKLRPLVAWALQELTGERATEVLPTLCRIFFKGPSLSGSIWEDIQPFIIGRQRVSIWITL